MSRLVIKKKTEPSKTHPPLRACKTEWEVECGEIIDEDTTVSVYKFDIKAEAIAGFYEQIGRKCYDYVDLVERQNVVDGCCESSDSIKEWKRVYEEDLKQEEPCDRCPSESLSYCMSNGCEEEKSDYWGVKDGFVRFCFQSKAYMDDNFDGYGDLSDYEDSRKLDRQTTEEMIAERNWEEESHRAIDWVFDGWEGDADVEECDKYDPGAVAVYFRKKKPE